jgi:hypothetical protein
MDIKTSEEQTLKKKMVKNESQTKQYRRKNYREINAEATLVDEKSVYHIKC